MDHMQGFIGKLFETALEQMNLSEPVERYITLMIEYSLLRNAASPSEGEEINAALEQNWTARKEISATIEQIASESSTEKEVLHVVNNVLSDHLTQVTEERVRKVADALFEQHDDLQLDEENLLTALHILNPRDTLTPREDEALDNIAQHVLYDLVDEILARNECFKTHNESEEKLLETLQQAQHSSDQQLASLFRPFSEGTQSYMSDAIEMRIAEMTEALTIDDIKNRISSIEKSLDNTVEHTFAFDIDAALADIKAMVSKKELTDNQLGDDEQKIVDAFAKIGKQHFIAGELLNAEAFEPTTSNSGASPEALREIFQKRVIISEAVKDEGLRSYSPKARGTVIEAISKKAAESILSNDEALLSTAQNLLQDIKGWKVNKTKLPEALEQMQAQARSVLERPPHEYPGIKVVGANAEVGDTVHTNNKDIERVG